MNNGYKGMLRDRCPKTVDFALKWCKAKDRWVEHTYNGFVRFLKENKDRKAATRAVLGIRKGKPKHFDFHSSIFWDQFGMTPEETAYWKWVEDWVTWFSKTFLYIESMYRNSLSSGKYSDEEFKQRIIDSYLKGVDSKTQEDLSKFLLKCVKE